MKNVPELRFNEFNDEWKEEKLGNILKYEQPNKYISQELNKKGNTPVLTANKSFILGYTNEANYIYTNLPAIIFDDFTTDNKYVNFPFKIRSGAIKILTHKKHNIKFVYYKMNLIKFKLGNEHKRYWISEFRYLKISLPSLPEQQKIVSFISAIDKKIELTDKKLEFLEKYKKGLMQKLLTGEIIFPGFNDEWKEIILKKAAEFQKGTSITKHFTSSGNIPVIAGGTKPAYFHNQFNRNEPIITLSSSGASAGYVNFFEIPIFASDCFTIKGKEKTLNTKFLFFILKNIQDKIYLLQHGGAQPHIYPKDLFNFKFYYPSLPEQQKIASFLSTIDKKIELVKLRLENLKRYKKGLLQKMFV